MMKKARRLKKEADKEQEEFNVLDELFLSLSKRLDKVPVGEGKKAVIKWSVIGVLLIVASSVLFHFAQLGTWIPAIVGAPAGLIFYLIGLGLVTRTTLSEWEIFHMRENYSFKQRMKRLGVGALVYALTFIPLGKYIPYGLGGTLVIVLALVALTVARKTPQELIWAKQGVPDPRDLEDEDDEDNYAEQDEGVQDTTTDADTIYYDNNRGGFGGKLN